MFRKCRTRNIRSIFNCFSNHFTVLLQDVSLTKNNVASNRWISRTLSSWGWQIFKSSFLEPMVWKEKIPKLDAKVTQPDVIWIFPHGNTWEKPFIIDLQQHQKIWNDAMLANVTEGFRGCTKRIRSCWKSDFFVLKSPFWILDWKFS